MNDCLVTKLKGTVDNDSLLKLGELKIKVKTKEAAFRFILLYPKDTNDADVYFSTPLDVYDWADSSHLVAGQTTHCTYYLQSIEIPANSEVTISALNKYKIIDVGGSFNTDIEIEFEGFDCLPYLKRIDFNGDGHGSVMGIKVVPFSTEDDGVLGYSLLQLALQSTDFAGDLEVLSSSHIDNYNITGDLRNLNLTGNIETIFANSQDLSRLVGTGSPYLTGSIDTMCNNFVAAGRNSGHIDLYKNPNMTISNPKPDSNWYTIYFGSDMAGQDPTPAETTQGWCAR